MSTGHACAPGAGCKTPSSKSPPATYSMISRFAGKKAVGGQIPVRWYGPMGASPAELRPDKAMPALP